MYIVIKHILDSISDTRNTTQQNVIIDNILKGNNPVNDGTSFTTEDKKYIKNNLPIIKKYSYRSSYTASKRQKISINPPVPIFQTVPTGSKLSGGTNKITRKIFTDNKCNSYIKFNNLS